MKKSIYVLLMLTFYLSYTSSSSFVTATTGLRLTRRIIMEELRAGASETAREHTFEVNWEGKGVFEGEGHESSEGLIYNADYRGVSTHPSPVLPKHPKKP